MKTRKLGSVASLVVALAACSGAQHRASLPWHPRQGPTMDQLLNVHRASSPTLSSDGAAMGFLSDAAGLPQAYAVRVLAEGAAPETAWRRLVSATERVQYLAWSPAGASVLFGRDTGGDENTQIFRVAPDGGDASAITRAGAKTLFGAISDDGRTLAYASNERSPADFDIYVRPLDADTPRRVMEAAGHHEPADFSGDGRQLVVVEEHSSFDQDLFVVDVATGTGRNLTSHTRGTDVRFQSPRFTADGRALLVLTDHDREHMNLGMLRLDDASTGAVHFVIEDDHDIDVFELSRDARYGAAVFNFDGYSRLRLYDLRDPTHPRMISEPALPPGVIGTVSFSGDGRSLAVDLSRATSPDEVYRVEVSTGAVARATQSDHAGLSESGLVEPVVEHVRSFDGVDVPVFVFRPRDLAPGERAPAVVWVHGGPEAQFTPYFSAVIQYLVGHGYVVAAPNVRGSTGYGKRYAHLDDVARREDSVRDLAAVNRWLRARGDIAPERIAVMGGSYGGYMVLAALTIDPDLWAAGCDIVGIANFRTFLERTAPYRRALREAEYGSLTTDGALLDQISPLHRVDRIRAPLFVIHGVNDPRVPVQEAEQIVEALRARHQRVEYIRFDNEGHGIFRRENKIRAYGALVAFFDEVLGQRP